MEPNQNSSGMMNGMPMMPKEHKKVGPIIGALVLVLVIIIAALYFLGQRTDTDTSSTTTEESEQNEVVRNESAAFDSATAAEFDSDLDAQMSDVDYSF